jgi:hypothetical protein
MGPRTPVRKEGGEERGKKGEGRQRNRCSYFPSMPDWRNGRREEEGREGKGREGKL